MLNVYIVDDEQPIIDELLKIIDWKALGYNVCGYANDAVTALEDIKKNKPDLLICDINMSGMNGFELIKEIAKIRLSVEIVLLTAYDLFDYALQAIKLRVRSYIIKPVNKKEINAVLKEFRRERCTKLFMPFFEMLQNGLPDEKVIKSVENECFKSGFIRGSKRYVFAFSENDGEYSGILAEYRVANGVYMLIELLDEQDESDLPSLYSEIFLYGSNFYKNAKEVFLLSLKNDSDEGEQKQIDIVIQKIMEDIETEYAQKISLAFYAERYHYNLSYLSKQFKLKVGMNFMDWLLKFRMNKGKELMKNKTLVLNDIAARVGYDDYGHFCKTFKKSEGISPQEYRTNYC